MMKLKILELEDIEKIVTDGFLKIYVNNGDIGFMENEEGLVIGSESMEKILLANIYLMLRDLCKNCHKDACQGDQSACDRNDQ